MSFARIEAVMARQVLDSRGVPTVEVEVRCGGAVGRAIVPTGASTGRHEARELRDGDPARHGGMSVARAVGHVRDILGPRLRGLSADGQRNIDALLCELDGTADKSRLGANAILGVSLACAHAAAAARALPLWRHIQDLAAPAPPPSLPMPMVNMISGGLHAGRNLDLQDFLVIPVGAVSFSEALHTCVSVYRALGEVLRAAGYEGVLVGDEGGFGPRLDSNEQALDLLVQAIRRAGCRPGNDAAIALDVAATHFFKDGRYHLAAQDGRQGLASDDMARWLAGLVDRFPIVSIEDGMAEDDWEGWTLLTQALPHRVQVIGDDLFVTNPQRLLQGIERGVGNAILVKPNQIGTLTETLDVIAQARRAGYRTIVSARSGETEDTTIADLAVGAAAEQIKIGSVARSERLAKYNQLLRIEEEGLAFSDALFRQGTRG